MTLVEGAIDVDSGTRLRPVRLDDAPALFALVDSNRVAFREWLPWIDGTRTADDTRAFLAGVIGANQAGVGAVLLIESGGRPCGVVGFNWVGAVNRSAGLGYWLAESHQGRGIMSASVRRLTEFGFEKLRLHRISIAAAEHNEKSRAIPERLGFRFEGVMRDAEWLYDRFVDHRLYARLSTDPG